MFWVLLFVTCTAGFCYGYVCYDQEKKNLKAKRTAGIVFLVTAAATIVWIIVKEYWIGLLWLAAAFIIFPLIGGLAIKTYWMKRGQGR